jgi:hypothetical protein
MTLEGSAKKNVTNSEKNRLAFVGEELSVDFQIALTDYKREIRFGNSKHLRKLSGKKRFKM